MKTSWIYENIIRRDGKYSHLKLLLGWVLYIFMYITTDAFIPESRCHIVHTALDDMIPFNEYFIIFYVAWYLWIVLTLLYYLRYDVESFKKLQVFFNIVQLIAVIFYIIYPTMQIGRPEVFPRDNFFTQIVAGIYAADTPTGVCPSIHVAYSLGIAASWLSKEKTGTLTKTVMIVLAVLISISTLFVKQHSVVDLFAAIPLAVLGDYLVYHRIGKGKPPLQGFIDRF